MRWMRRLTLLALVAAFLLARSTHAAPDAALAQTRKPIVMTRIYTGPDRQSHAEEVEIKLTDRGIAEFKATGVEFSSRPAAPVPADAWHTGPRRQFVITLSGRAELELGGGQKVQTGPGHIDLIEDTTGQGHITRNLEDRVVVTIPFEDQPASGAGR